jgi:hypothetical protein
MSDTTERTYTLAEVRVMQREAYRRACLNESMSYDRADELARTAYPDPEPPEPERRWVMTWDDKEIARDPDGTWWCRRYGKVKLQEGATDEHMRALASLLPRVPVTVTEEMEAKAFRAYMTSEDGVWAGIRAALLAVASDLAQPVHACQHKTKWWGVIDNKGSRVLFVDEAEARKSAARWNRNVPDDAPHRVIPLAEVDHA